jgi:hypothetical protein
LGVYNASSDFGLYTNFIQNLIQNLFAYKLGPNILSLFSSTQVQSLNIPILSLQQIQSFSNLQMPGLTTIELQTIVLATGIELYESLSITQLEYSPNAVSLLSSTELVVVLENGFDQLSFLTSTQIKNLPIKTIQSLTPSQIASITYNQFTIVNKYKLFISLFTVDQLKNSLTPSQLNEIIYNDHPLAKIAGNINYTNYNIGLANQAKVINKIVLKNAIDSITIGMSIQLAYNNGTIAFPDPTKNTGDVYITNISEDGLSLTLSKNLESDINSTNNSTVILFTNHLLQHFLGSISGVTNPKSNIFLGFVNNNIGVGNNVNSILENIPFPTFNYISGGLVQGNPFV